jgi:hypothetical protein
MGENAFDSIMAGLEDALAYTKGDGARGRATVLEVAAHRDRSRSGLGPEGAEDRAERGDGET